ncbi:MAG: hypothetical protein E2O39_11995 [Planctomycetota bacterium]|nr:MAG: hypothetical protein E2O39_11995 [Planctomycetota bacterium]
MNHRSPRHSRWLAALLFGAALAATACASTEPSPEQDAQPVSPSGPLEAEPWEPPQPKPWTDEFYRRAALLADRIHIEGPAGLLEHVVPSVDARVYSYTVKVIAEGFLQVTKVLGPESPPISVQLDGWQIMALEELTILERVDDCEVSIVARGDAYWMDPATGKEEREDVLRFSATIEE